MVENTEIRAGQAVSPHIISSAQWFSYVMSMSYCHTGGNMCRSSGSDTALTVMTSVTLEVTGWRGSQHPGLSTRRWPLGTSLQPKRSAAAAADQISILFFKSTTRSFVCILIGSETAGGGCWTLLCSRLLTPASDTAPRAAAVPGSPRHHHTRWQRRSRFLWAIYHPHGRFFYRGLKPMFAWILPIFVPIFVAVDPLPLTKY